jgi:hypothetical protein
MSLLKSIPEIKALYLEYGDNLGASVYEVWNLCEEIESLRIELGEAQRKIDAAIKHIDSNIQAREPYYGMSHLLGVRAIIAEQQKSQDATIQTAALFTKFTIPRFTSTNKQHGTFQFNDKPPDILTSEEEE